MQRPHISRRNLLIAGGTGIGLVVGYALWPRRVLTAVDAAPGEAVLNGFVRVGLDGHVAIVVPQVELGHGVFTTLAQIVADELGADWRTIAVETARPGPLYANALFARERDEALGTGLFSGVKATLATGESGSVRAWEATLRDAGSAARALLCAAAAARWDADWRACDTHDGFVWRGDDKMRFGEISAEAAKLDVPQGVSHRTGEANRLSGSALPRLDLPSKVDGSVNYAGDIRLPDMVYAVLARGVDDGKLVSFDRKAAERVTGFLDLVDTERWIAAVATNGWAAGKALEALASRFEKPARTVGDRDITRALDAAFVDGGTRLASAGDIGAAFANADIFVQSYRIGFAPHAAIETASATAWLAGGTLELWMATQLPEAAAAAAARACGLSVDRVVLHPTMVGGSFGARYEVEIAGHVALLAQRLKRPVQLVTSRADELRHDRFRPAAAAKMAARTDADGRIAAWYARIATPASAHELHARIGGASASAARAAAKGVSEPAAIAGAMPPYAIPIYALDHCPADLGIATGDWRGRMHGANVFFRECFVDEVAHMTGGEPFSVRMAMLGDNPRLARCLTEVAVLGNWQGGVQGSGQGLALHEMAGSCIAVLAEAQIGDAGRPRVTRLFAVADVGRVINPDVVRAQIVGGLVFGLSAATGAAISVSRSIPGPQRFGDLRLPTLADCPKIEVQLVISGVTPGGAGELAVPPVAPAVAGALFAATGTRYRQLPLTGAL